jgi:DNA-binding transcriptional MerR regulator
MSTDWLGPRALAAATGVSTDTLRHYERLRLLGLVSRTASGYRRYPPACVARVQLVQRALLIGFSLKELASVLGHRDRGGAPCGRVRALVGERLDRLDQRLAELTALRDEMRRLLAEWDVRLAATPPDSQARLLDMLGGRPELAGGARDRSVRPEGSPISRPKRPGQRMR